MRVAVFRGYSAFNPLDLISFVLPPKVNAPVPIVAPTQVPQPHVPAPIWPYVVGGVGALALVGALVTFVVKR